VKVQYDGPVTLAVGSSRTAAHWKNKTMQWSAFLNTIQTTTQTRETLAEYLKLPKSKQDAIKDVGGFVGGWLKQGRRKAENLEHRSMLTLDADFATMDLLESLSMFYGCAAAVYSTHKHCTDTPRLRLIVPLTRQLSGDEYQAVARMLANDLGMDLFDDTTYQPTRLMYWPSTPVDQQYYFDCTDGPWLNPDTLLARYPDWRDTSYWPESSRAANVRHTAAKHQGDPTAKPGVVGAFCRTYNVEQAIERFLPDRYTACEMEGRYTYVGGSTSAGLVVYDGGLFAYSNHATDPVSGRLCNAFDLVRLHLYGEQDSESAEGTPVNKLPSYAAMVELARTDEAVKLTSARERLDQARGDFDIPDEGQADDTWIAQLEVDKRGVPMQTIQNAYIILSSDPLLKGTLAYNCFKDRIVAIQNLPWKEVQDTVNGDAWTDADDSELRRYMELAYRITGKERIMDAVSGVARANTIHPVRSFLKGLEWDGVERLDTLLIDYLGAEDTPYIRAVTRKAFTAAVARIVNPGCKFDYVLTLAGPQGRGNSTLINKMSCGWYTDSLAGIGTKEAYEGIQGFWLVELGELAAMKKTEIEVTKNFISKQVDSYRAPYGRRVEDHKRQCVFFGTTNSAAFLRDDTGNRRFWPVRLGDEPPACTVWNDLTTDIVHQLWAEAVIRYEEDELLTLTGELEAAACEQQREFTEDDPRAGEVQLYLDRLLPEDWDDKDKLDRRAWLSDDFGTAEGMKPRMAVCVAEIWNECFKSDIEKMSRQDSQAIAAILRRTPGWVEEKGRQRCGIYGLQKRFRRVAWVRDVS
jgi:predicted P-loop ATPase